MLFIPIDIPSKYFPLVMYAFVSLFSGPQLDLAVAMLVGYLQVKGYLDKLSPSITFLERCESTGVLSSLTSSTGWVRNTGVISGGMWNQMESGEEPQVRQPFVGSSSSTTTSSNIYGVNDNREEGKSEHKEAVIYNILYYFILLYM